MFDLNNPQDVIAQMAEGGMTLQAVKKTLELTLRELKDYDNCWSCDTICSNYSEYQDDGQSFCSLDCMNEAD